jgi:ribosomal subunit interface protein
MKIDITAVKFELDTKVRDYAAEKIGRLEKYYKNIVKADVTLEEHAGDTANVRYGAKVRVEIPGGDIFAEDFDKDIYTAIDKTEKKAREQLVRTKEKRNPNPIHRARKWIKGFFGDKEE